MCNKNSVLNEQILLYIFGTFGIHCTGNLKSEKALTNKILNVKEKHEKKCVFVFIQIIYYTCKYNKYITNVFFNNVY